MLPSGIWPIPPDESFILPALVRKILAFYGQVPPPACPKSRNFELQSASCKALEGVEPADEALFGRAPPHRKSVLSYPAPLSQQHLGIRDASWSTTPSKDWSVDSSDKLFVKLFFNVIKNLLQSFAHHVSFPPGSNLMKIHTSYTLCTRHQSKKKRSSGTNDRPAACTDSTERIRGYDRSL